MLSSRVFAEIQKVRWYVRDRGELGLNKTNKIAILYADNVVRLLFVDKVCVIKVILMRLPRNARKVDISLL